MSKHPRIWNQTSYEQRLKHGRGSGEGIKYRPWISVQDFSSRGTITRVRGWKTNRVHHFMSNCELQYFFLLEWADTVTDIREQYPLLDVSATMDIARAAGIIHPYDRYSGFPYVLTSDFLITTTQGTAVRTVKMSDELDNRRVLEKLEIERRYWFGRGIDWRLITEKEINRQKAKNIEWLHNSKVLSGLPYDDDLVTAMASKIATQYFGTNYPILDICNRIDNTFRVHSGTGLTLFKYLVANKRIPIDMEQPPALSVRRGQVEAIVEKVAI